jgi:hypothetical protein
LGNNRHILYSNPPSCAAYLSASNVFVGLVFLQFGAPLNHTLAAYANNTPVFYTAAPNSGRYDWTVSQTSFLLNLSGAVRIVLVPVPE